MNIQTCLATSMSSRSLLQTNTKLILSACFTNVCLHPKNECQIPIHSRDIDNQRILKSNKMRACQG